jgi:hypothetical protein
MGGLVISAPLLPCFSGAGLAAHEIPETRKRGIKRTRKRKIDRLKSDFILPP